MQSCPEEQALLEPAQKLIGATHSSETQYLIPTEIAQKLSELWGCAVKSAQVNTWLFEIGLQYKLYRESKSNPGTQKWKWDLTEEGKKYGRIYLAANAASNWSGGQPQWSQTVIELIVQHQRKEAC